MYEWHLPIRALRRTEWVRENGNCDARETQRGTIELEFNVKQDARHSYGRNDKECKLLRAYVS